MARYQDQEESVAKSVLVDGFFRTGDAGYIDDDGFIYLTDRVKELIKVKGCVITRKTTSAMLESLTRLLQKSSCPR